MFLIHNYLETGSIGIGEPLSETELEIRKLDERLTDAVRAYQVAGRSAAVGGISTGAETALSGVRYVEREMKRLAMRLATEKEEQRFQALEARLKQVKRDMGIP